MKVLINGIGNIGTTLALVLQQHKKTLGISKVVAFKNNLLPWQKVDLDFLSSQGVSVIDSRENSLDSIAAEVDFIFDTTANGYAMKNKSVYISHSNIKGVIAQGSENGFGTQFMSGLPIALQSEKFVQIVSCNTHAAASILNLFDSFELKNTKIADFVVVRRSEDLGNHERLVTANVVARHLSETTGTHHAIDVKSMFKQLGIDCPITSSDITTPSQLMHATRFHIETKTDIDWQLVEKKIQANSLVATSTKFDSNTIFELGRRYGAFGRIYNHVIIVKNNLLKTENSVKGWAFVPQEGNTIISTIEAFLYMTESSSAAEISQKIKESLCHKEW